MFIDRVTIEVKAGDGGDGCVSFRREKHVPRGGPDGGDGGRGGDVFMGVDPQMRTLLDLRYRKRYKAKNGQRGKGKRMTGRSGEATVVHVPSGTVVENAETGELIADLTEAGQEIVVARGGAGGKGNYNFRSPTNQAPRQFTRGVRGEEHKLLVTLKLIADVGLVGLPNAGKSTLLRSVSDAHPVVAQYPFSTVTPVLGMVRIEEGASFCMVDIPGLIEGAHRGKGLGIQFLQHIERCKVLLLLIDVGDEIAIDDAYRQLLDELRLYKEELLERPRLVALNKIDLLAGTGVTLKPPKLEGERIYHISALERIGLRELVLALYRDINRAVESQNG